MNLSHITSQSLRRVLSLTERKDELVKLVAEIETEIAKTLTGIAAPVAAVITSKAPAAKGKGGRKKGRKSKSGGLKGRILDLLDAAGEQGLRVKEIAEKLGAPAGNISVWFSTTGKKLTTKLEPGRYAAKSAKPATAPAAKPSKPAKKSGRKKVAKAAKTAGKPAKVKAFKLPPKSAKA